MLYKVIPSRVLVFNICLSLAHLVNLANRIICASHLLNIFSKSNRISSYSTSSSYAFLKAISYLLFLLHRVGCRYTTVNLKWFIKTVIDLKYCSVLNNIVTHLVCNLKSQISRGSWRRDDRSFSSKKTVHNSPWCFSFKLSWGWHLRLINYSVKYVQLNAI